MKTVIDAVNEFHAVWPWINKPLMSHFHSENPLELNGIWQPVCTKSEFYDCVEELSKAEWIKPAMTKPIYTQEMADNGNLASVGMECLINDETCSEEYFPVVILFVGKRNIVWRDENNDEHSQSSVHLSFKPLTPPITLTEKAINEACLIINDSIRCLDTNINVDCSAAQKAVIITMINKGYRLPLNT